MHATVINFHLKDWTEPAYQQLCRDVAPAFAEVPGLICKVWLADRMSGTYGGIYLWQDEAAFKNFTKSELFASVGGHPNLTDITVKDFGVLDEPTAVTRGLIGVSA